jgi:hypothetical protein
MYEIIKDIFKVETTEALISEFQKKSKNTDPVSETLCFEKTKMMDNVHNNSHV